MTQSSPTSLLLRLRTHPHVRWSGKLVLDLGAAAVAWVFAERLLSTSGLTPGGLWKWVALALVINLTFRLTSQHYRLIGFMDGVRIAFAALVLVAGSLFLAFILAPAYRMGYAKTAIAAALITGGFWMALRGLIRAQHDHRHGAISQDSPCRHRTLIVGAGRAGLLVAQEIQRHPQLSSHVVGFVDDASDKQGIRIQGTPVLGPISSLSTVIKDEAITQVVLAIPSATGATLRALSEVVRKAGVTLKTVPGVHDLLGPRTWKPEIRNVDISDLLRREPNDLDQSGLRAIIEDSVVLITGGGGSIGSELARQAAAFRPSRVVLLGRGENSLWDAERSLRALFTNQALSLELCDIRNPTRLTHAFERWHPDVVLHAAAHKHVPFLETHPEEAVENNIFGTENVLNAAIAVGAHSFVNISTDKAVNPTNVLGASKRIAEYLVLRAARRIDGNSCFASVRFGNVLGSRGSVVPIFQEQINAGGPITLTDPEMVRYFMTIPEASQLALQAGILGETGKVYVLDMGEPVRILDLAKDMAKLSNLTPGEDIEIVYSGMRPGEKLFEEMFYGEPLPSKVHPKVFEGSPEAPADEVLEKGLDCLRKALLEPEGARQHGILTCLKRLVPSYAPSPTGLGRYEASPRRDRTPSGRDWPYPSKEGQAS